MLTNFFDCASWIGRPNLVKRARVRSRLDLELRRIQSNLVLTFSRIDRIIDRQVIDLFEQDGIRDLTRAQATLLINLFQEKRPLTSKQIAELMELSEVTVGRFVHALERGGWIRRQRDPDDGRAILITPTRRAYKMLPSFIRVSNAILDRALAGLSRAQTIELAQTIERMRFNLAEISGTTVTLHPDGSSTPALTRGTSPRRSLDRR